MKIFLTGGSSGIGHALLHNLAWDHEIHSPERSFCDLSDQPLVDFNGFDALILCAGSDLGGKTPFCSMLESDWRDTMQVNLLSNMSLIQQFVQSRQDQWAKIIVFGSTATHHIWPGMIPYGVAKLALESFCRALRQEIPATLGISIIRPGLTRTGFNYRRWKGQLTLEQSQQWYDSQPHLLPENFVEPVRQILDDRSHSIKEVTISL